MESTLGTPQASERSLPPPERNPLCTLGGPPGGQIWLPGISRNLGNPKFSESVFRRGYGPGTPRNHTFHLAIQLIKRSIFRAPFALLKSSPFGRPRRAHLREGRMYVCTCGGPSRRAARAACGQPERRDAAAGVSIGTIGPRMPSGPSGGTSGGAPWGPDLAPRNLQKS